MGDEFGRRFLPERSLSPQPFVTGDIGELAITGVQVFDPWEA